MVSFEWTCICVLTVPTGRLTCLFGFKPMYWYLFLCFLVFYWTFLNPLVCFIMFRVKFPVILYLLLYILQFMIFIAGCGIWQIHSTEGLPGIWMVWRYTWGCSIKWSCKDVWLGGIHIWLGEKQCADIWYNSTRCRCDQHGPLGLHFKPWKLFADMYLPSPGAWPRARGVKSASFLYAFRSRVPSRCAYSRVLVSA
jgi:hypothetical protein